PFHGLIPSYDDLRDAVAGADRVRLAAEVQKNDADFAAITRVDGAGRIRHSDGVLQGQTAARTHLRFVTGRRLDSQAGGYQARHAGFQRDVFYRVQVHTGILRRPVGVSGQDGARVDAMNTDLHSSLS